MKTIFSILSMFLFLSCNQVKDEFKLVDLSKSTKLNSPETILSFDDKYPESIKIVDSLVFIIQVKSDTCISVYNLLTKQKVISLGRIGHGSSDLINPNFILSADNSDVLLDVGNLKKIMKIECNADSIYLKKDIPYPDNIFISSETNFSENYIVGRKIDALAGKMFYIFNKNTSETLEIDCFPKIEESIADMNYAFAPTIAFNEQRGRIIIGMYFFDLIHVYDLGGRRINTFRFSENSTPSVNRKTRMLELEKGYSGFTRCFPTANSCYVMHITTNPIKNEFEKILIKMDWDGNMVNSYKFVDNVSGQFYIDENANKIYTICNALNLNGDEVFNIVSYNL